MAPAVHDERTFVGQERLVGKRRNEPCRIAMLATHDQREADV